MPRRRDTPVDKWPDWYLIDVLRAIGDLAPRYDDENLRRLWKAYCAAAPAPEAE